jgi:hypothetical protein
MLAAENISPTASADHVGHALAAIFGVAFERRASRPRAAVEAALKPSGVRTTPFSSVQPSVADLVERGQHLAGELAGLLEDRAGERRVSSA